MVPVLEAIRKRSAELPAVPTIVSLDDGVEEPIPTKSDALLRVVYPPDEVNAPLVIPSELVATHVTPEPVV